MKASRWVSFIFVFFMSAAPCFGGPVPSLRFLVSLLDEGLPTATQSEHTALTRGLVISTSDGEVERPARYDVTIAGSLLIDYGRPITNTVAGPPNARIGFSAFNLSEGTCRFEGITASSLVIDHNAGTIRIPLPPVQQGDCGQFFFYLTNVRVSLPGYGSSALNATVSPTPQPDYLVENSTPTVISQIRRGLIDPYSDDESGGTATINYNGTVLDPTFQFAVTEGHGEAFQTELCPDNFLSIEGPTPRSQSPDCLNDTQLLLRFTGIPEGVTLDLMGGGPVTLDGYEGALEFPAADLSNRLITNRTTTTTLSLINVFPFDGIQEAIRFRGTVSTTGGGFSAGTIRVQVSLGPTGSALGAGGAPLVASGTAVPRFQSAFQPSPGLPVVLISSPPTLPTLTASPASLAFAATVGGPAPAPQSASISTRRDERIPFSARIRYTSGANWLQVSPTSGDTPARINVTANHAGLAAGVYNATVNITSTRAENSLDIPVTLTVAPPPNLTASRNSILFTAVLGSGTPLQETFSITSTGPPVSFTVTTPNTPWLTAFSSSGETPATVTVIAGPAGLAAGDHAGAVVVTGAAAANSPLRISVTLRVTDPAPPAPAPDLQVSPDSLTFNHQIGSTPPASQNISVGSSGAALEFSAAAATTSGGNWLSANPGAGTTAASVRVAVDPGNLSAGTYNGTVRITAGAASNSPRTVSVTLTVRPAAPPPTLTVTQLPNTANPAQQLPLGLTRAPAEPVATSGCLSLTFSPESAVPVDDPMVQFTTGGRALGFTIPANSTTAALPPTTGVQTGTTAGMITVLSSLAACPAGGPTTVLHTMRVSPSAPNIISVEVVRTAAGFDIRTRGFSTTRQLTRASFRFDPRPGSEFVSVELARDVAADFATWYQNPTSGQFGTEFQYVQPFAIQGDLSDLGTVVVTLSNSQGSTSFRPVNIAP